jgi:hypothetical protein
MQSSVGSTVEVQWSHDPEFGSLNPVTPGSDMK